MTNTKATSGVSLTTIFILLAILQLSGAISISWWWITAPLWIVPALFIVGGAVVLTFGAIVKGWARLRSRPITGGVR